MYLLIRRSVKSGLFCNIVDGRFSWAGAKAEIAKREKETRDYYYEIQAA